MRAVVGSVTSSKAISVAKASAILSRFASADVSARRDVAAYLKRASAAFDELALLHRDLRDHKRSHLSSSADTEQVKPRSTSTIRGVLDEEDSNTMMMSGKKKKKRDRGEDSDDGRRVSASDEEKMKKKYKKERGNLDDMFPKEPKKEKLKTEQVDAEVEVEEKSRKEEKKKKKKKIKEEDDPVPIRGVESGGNNVKESERGNGVLDVHGDKEGRKKRKHFGVEGGNETPQRKKKMKT